MKNIILSIASSVLFLQSCASQIYMEPQQLATVLQSGEFMFTAKRANPTNYAVINTVSSIPNATSTRILDLGTGYGIQFKNKEMIVSLPYFGQAYRAPSNPDKASFRFTSKDFSMQQSQDKKGKIIYTIEPRDITNVQKIYLEVYPKGSAMVSINASDRQPISYDGYIEKLPAEQ
ncbi:MAG: DUF4251 domain-containing protein [Bacteroidetes bacterium]|nr:DUF4251 domain-containing protein [Bacteroidota bacterium]